MHTQPSTPQNRPTGVNLPVYPSIKPTMPWRVVEVRPMPDFKIHVCFVDGTQGEVDMNPLVHSPAAGVFASLANPLVFAQVGIEHGAVTWPGEIDLAPDAMYDEIKCHGTWVLR
jgi:hypothetical protein